MENHLDNPWQDISAYQLLSEIVRRCFDGASQSPHARIHATSQPFSAISGENFTHLVQFHCIECLLWMESAIFLHALYNVVERVHSVAVKNPKWVFFWAPFDCEVASQSHPLLPRLCKRQHLPSDLRTKRWLSGSWVVLHNLRISRSLFSGEHYTKWLGVLCRPASFQTFQIQQDIEKI